MKAKELIKDLKRFHPDQEVKFCTGPGNEFNILSIYDDQGCREHGNGKGAPVNISSPIWVDLG